MKDALIFDNGNDVFARIKGGDVISHKSNDRQTRLTAALHFASLLDPGPRGGFEVISDHALVSKESPRQPAEIISSPLTLA